MEHIVTVELGCAEWGKTMIKRILTLSGILTAGLFWTSIGFTAGVWDDNVVLLGVNANGSYQIADEVRIKKASGGNSGCTVVKFRPGSGSIPADTNGTAARDRIYATALAAYLTDKPVSIWVWDTNCYGVMLVFTDSSGF